MGRVHSVLLMVLCFGSSLVNAENAAGSIFDEAKAKFDSATAVEAETVPSTFQKFSGECVANLKPNSLESRPLRFGQVSDPVLGNVIKVEHRITNYQLSNVFVLKPGEGFGSWNSKWNDGDFIIPIRCELRQNKTDKYYMNVCDTKLCALVVEYSFGTYCKAWKRFREYCWYSW